MDGLLLAKIQFAFCAGFHYLFPPTTLGLSFVIAIVETLYAKTGKEHYKTLSSFLIKILGLVFTVGVATGITLEFAFGTNWSNYSRVVGDIFGAPLAAEGIFAFFMESIFLGILLFGRDKVSKKVYLLSAYLVFFGSHLSGLWIIIANSFMQTPAGYEMVQGKAVLTDFFKAAFNPSTIVRFTHTIIGGWIAGSLFSAAIGAWYLLKGKFEKIAKSLVTVSLILFLSASFIQLVSGHGHAVQVAKTQPEKMAAFEGLWETQKGAPMSLFGIPDEKEEKTHLNIKIPKLLSFLIYFNGDKEVKGLKDFPVEDRPPVFLTYWSYHIMIMLGMAFIAFGLTALYLLVRRKVFEKKWFIRSILFLVPVPYLANEFGWMAAEIGRQPWAVYRVLRTADAASVVVPAWQILLTLITFFIVYAFIFAVFIKILRKIIKKGPDKNIQAGY